MGESVNAMEVRGSTKGDGTEVNGTNPNKGGEGDGDTQNAIDKVDARCITTNPVLRV